MQKSVFEAEGGREAALLRANMHSQKHPRHCWQRAIFHSRYSSHPERLLAETNKAPRETLFQGGKGNHVRQAKMGSKLDRAAACSFPLLSCPEPPLKAAQRHGQHRHTDHLKHIFQSMRMLRHKVATACSTERKNCRRARSVGGFGGTAPTR